MRQGIFHRQVGRSPDRLDGPAEGERPSAYIIIACDLSLGRNKQWDDGIAAQTIMLSAVEKGYGGCMIGALTAANWHKRWT